MKVSQLKKLLLASVSVLSLGTLVNSTVIIKAQDTTSSASVSLGTTFGEKFYELINAKDPQKHEAFSDLQTILNLIREESGATYVYLILPIKDDKASIEGDAEGDFMLTIDGSKEPEEWGITYDAEAQFEEAWNGEVAAARSAWNDGDTEQNWSAFAPILNMNGDVVALLGIDFSATEVIAKYPEWNRDDEKWNGATHEWPKEIPAEIQELVDQVKDLTDGYAKKLSGVKD